MIFFWLSPYTSNLIHPVQLLLPNQVHGRNPGDSFYDANGVQLRSRFRETLGQRFSFVHPRVLCVYDVLTCATSCGFCGMQPAATTSLPGEARTCCGESKPIVA